MPPRLAPDSLLWAVRGVVLLGLLALTLTGEMTPVVLQLAWGAWGLSFFLDSHPAQQEKLRPWDPLAVIVFMSFFLYDFFVHHSTIFVAVSHFLLLFQTYKLLGLKTSKDTLQMILFGFFQVMGGCTLSADFWQALVLLMLIPSGITALFWHQTAVDLERENKLLPPETFRAFRRVAAAIALGALPVILCLTVGVFIFFPRLNLNLRIPGFGNDRIGFSEEVNLTRTGDLREDDTAVLWIQFAQVSQRLDWNGYLRGGTFEWFDGRQWKSSPSIGSQLIRRDSNGVFTLSHPTGHYRPLMVEITQAVPATALFVPGVPYQVHTRLPHLEERMDGNLRNSFTGSRPLVYKVWSNMDPLHGTPQWPAPEDPSLYLAVPPIPLERVARLAKEAAGTGSARRRAEHLEAYLRTHYQYSTRLGDLRPPNPVDDFLFERRQGPCGYFASAMALMLRLEGIPSRVVGGYLRGEWNEPAAQVLIRERDAHAWVEAWIEGQGWTPFDPSPRQPEASSELSSWKQAWVTSRQYWDYLGLQWNRFVIEYDLFAQTRALESLRQSSLSINRWFARWIPWRQSPSPQTPEGTPSRPSWLLRAWGVSSAMTAGIILILFVGWRSRQSADRLSFYREFLQRMDRHGLPKQPYETGHEFAGRTSRRRPDLQDWIAENTERYYRERFANPSSIG